MNFSSTNFFLFWLFFDDSFIVCDDAETFGDMTFVLVRIFCWLIEHDLFACFALLVKVVAIITFISSILMANLRGFGITHSYDNGSMVWHRRILWMLWRPDKCCSTNVGQKQKMWKVQLNQITDIQDWKWFLKVAFEKNVLQ